MRRRTALVVGGLVLAGLAFAAGHLVARAPGPGAGPPPPGGPVVALDAGAVDLGPGRPLTVDWSALAPPSVPLPSPGSAAAPVRAAPAPAAPRPAPSAPARSPAVPTAPAP